MPTKQEQTKELIGDVREMLTAAGGTTETQYADVKLALLLRIAKALEKEKSS